MVGDYITFPDVQNDSNCPKLRVIAINEEDVYVSIDGDPVADLCDPKELSGIPLTPEILEKNGFKDVSNHTLKGCETYELVFGRDYDQKIIYKLGDYFQYWSFDDRWYKLFETKICYKWCVHNLQHCLKLVGIKKDIVL